MMDFETIETEIVETLVDCGGVDEEEVHPWSRLVEDLRFDSIDLLDLIFRLEEHFEITLPVQSPGPVLKSVFTRKHFRVSDLVEMVYLQLGTGRPARRERSRWSRQENESVAARASTSMFTQLGGRLSDVQQLAEHQFTPLDSRGPLERYRRFRDGMVCVRIPAGSAVIGCDHGQADEGPAHTVEFDSFVIDTEAVSTTAYCRFLNSISVDDAQVRTWVALERDDHHADFTPIAHVDGR